MSAAEKMQPAPQRNQDSIPVRVLVLDNTKPQVVPGALSSTLRCDVGPKSPVVSGNKTKYSIRFVPRLRAFEVECKSTNGKVETVMVPEHMAVMWIGED